jgi:hypothetical protein
VSAEAAGLPHVFRVSTRKQLLDVVAGDANRREAVNGVLPSRSDSLFLFAEPYWINSPTGATRGSVLGCEAETSSSVFGRVLREMLEP